VARLSPAQQERITTIRGFQRTVEQVKRLVAELDGSRAAPMATITNLCASIERELSRLRQRALVTDMGTLGDMAGSMSVLAGRSIGIALKIRGLTEGVQSLEFELAAALAKTLARVEADRAGPPAPESPRRPDP
jgi:hypothetical protein